MRNVDIDNYAMDNLGKNYATVPHCEKCGYEPKPNSNYGIMLGDLRIHKEREHGQAKHLNRNRDRSKPRHQHIPF